MPSALPVLKERGQAKLPPDQGLFHAILFLPEEFVELLRLDTKPSFVPYAEMLRQGETLVLRIEIGDFTNDEVIVAATKNLIIVLGSRYPASFFMHFPLPSDADGRRARSRVNDSVLVIEMPLKAKPDSSAEDVSPSSGLPLGN